MAFVGSVSPTAFGQSRVRQTLVTHGIIAVFQQRDDSVFVVYAQTMRMSVTVLRVCLLRCLLSVLPLNRFLNLTFNLAFKQAKWLNKICA